MNSLSGLMTFASVVEHKSFSKAAEQMGTTNSAVSKQIAKLESRLKIRLLDRNTRGLTPTNAGNLIYHHCVRIADETQAIESMLDQWRTQPSGVLKVVASVSVARAFLSAGLPDFFKCFPEIQLELSYSEKNEESSTMRNDIAFVVTDSPPSNRVARRLAEIDYVVCGSPSYFEASGKPHAPRELLGHNCLLLSDSVTGRPARWRFTDSQNVTAEINVVGNTSTTDSDALLSLAKNSTGIALLPRFAAKESLQNGELMEVLSHYTAQNNQADALFAIYSPNPIQPQKIRAFIDFFAMRF